MREGDTHTEKEVCLGACAIMRECVRVYFIVWQPRDDK